MSRAHMIYEDKPLQGEGVGTSRWPEAWDPRRMHRGPGVLLEGLFRKKVKHVLHDSTGAKHRFIVFHVEFTQACQRKFDSQGQEVEPNFGKTGVVRTGYLHSSYKTEAKGTPDMLDFGQVSGRIQSPLAALVVPAHAQTLCFWGEESDYEHVELAHGQAVRLKTKGDCPLLDSFTRLDLDRRQYSANYTGGEGAGQSWTDRVMGVKQGQATPTPLPGQDKEGVAEDEWDD